MADVVAVIGACWTLCWLRWIGEQTAAIHYGSLILCAAIASALVCAGQDTAKIPEDVQKLTDGFYYKAQDVWQKLEPTQMAGGGLKHAGKMFVPGLTPQMVWTFRGAESPIQIAEPRPTFCIKEQPNAERGGWPDRARRRDCAVR